MSECIEKLKDFIYQEAIPVFYSYQVEKVYLNKKDRITDAEYCLAEYDNSITHATIEFLDMKLIEEKDRQKVIDEKARSSLVSISIIIAVMLTMLKEGTAINCPFNILVIIAVIYFLSAVLGAVKAIERLPYSQINVEDIVKLSGSSIEIHTSPDNDKLVSLFKYYKLNSILNNIKGNFVDASFKSIRNGVVILSLSIILMMF